MEKGLQNFVVQFVVQENGNLKYSNSDVKLKNYEVQQLSCRPEQIDLRGARYMKFQEICSVKKVFYIFRKPILNLNYMWAYDLPKK